MSDSELIVCRPTKWFYWRIIAMLGMFLFFCGWFLRDWKVGYAKKNEVYYTYFAFEKAKQDFPEHGRSEADWNRHFDSQTMGQVVQGVARAKAEKENKTYEPITVPPGVEDQQPWPGYLADHARYRKAYEADKEKSSPPLWVEYSAERGWESKVPKKPYTAGEVQEQLYYACGSGLLALVAIYFLVRTSRRAMKVDATHYYAPNGRKVAFDQIKRIDMRKWKPKGLAYLFYEEGGETKRAKVDGMVYGQFKEEEGAPAERLFQQILANFSGELVDLEEEEEGTEEEAGGEEPAEGEDGGVEDHQEAGSKD